MAGNGTVGLDRHLCPPSRDRVAVSTRGFQHHGRIRVWDPEMTLAQFLLPALAALSPSVASAADLEVCVRRNGADLFGFNEAFSKGAITVPTGTVFKWAGHTYGGAADPLDETHSLRYPAVGWRGVSKAEGDRRMQQMLDDGERQKGPTSAVITTREASLTKGRPCTVVPVATAGSAELRGESGPLTGDPGIYYQAYGVVQGVTLNTNWSAQPPALRSAGINGALNGVLKGKTDTVVDVRQ